MILVPYKPSVSVTALSSKLSIFSSPRKPLFIGPFSSQASRSTATSPLRATEMALQPTARAALTEQIVESVKVRAPSRPSRPLSPGDCSVSQSKILLESSAPSRVMYYRDGEWLDFSPAVVTVLRSGFEEKRPVVDVWIGGCKYLFDLSRMVQIDFGTKNQRSISWIDENGKCFFPKVFLDELQSLETDSKIINGLSRPCNQKIEIEIKIDGRSAKREREEPEVTSSLKSYESKRRRTEPASRWLTKTLLPDFDCAFLLVRDIFLSGMTKFDAGAKVSAIYRCTREGHIQRARYDVFQKQIEFTKAVRGAENMIFAWHGATAKEVESTLTHGFGLGAKTSFPDTVGLGFYFSPMNLPQLSARLAEDDDNGEKHIIFCRVILGNVEKVDVGSRQDHPSSEIFDTGSDDPKNPKWFVVWQTNVNMYVMPEYVVIYKPSAMEKFGQARVAAHTNIKLETFLSRIRNNLPPAKVQEIAKLYRTFKVGIFAKDAFVSQLRSVVGDEMLQTAIKEISARG